MELKQAFARFSEARAIRSRSRGNTFDWVSSHWKEVKLNEFLKRLTTDDNQPS